ncbi:MAG: C_GCAxxG_C_C family protein [Chloroflexota bacterium]|nr:MAG: C_GCAxxG_C_C family protein [Chloroflexota bacterium]
MVKLTKKRDEIVQKANELAVEYEAKYKGCGQCTFMAVVDALRWGGLEIIPRDMEDRLFPGLCLLTGGVGLSGDGTCGAVASGVLAIGLALGFQRDSINESLFRQSCAIVRGALLNKYYQKYNSVLCRDIQRKFFGKAWDLTRDEMSAEFLGISEGCVIVEGAMWVTEIILDEFEKGNVKGYVGSLDFEA